jgi:hypothetical protein
MEKKGAGHIEIIFAFVFFVGFVFFLFLTLKPYDTTVLPTSINQALADSFKEKSFTNLTTFSLKVTLQNPGNCFSIDLPKKTSLMYDFTNSYVESLTGKVNSSVKPEGNSGGGKLEIRPAPGDNFFRVFISPEFVEDNLVGCPKLNNSEIGNIFEKKVLSYNYIKSLSDRYKTDYDNLKLELGVPEVFDFAITCEEIPEISMDKNVVSSVDVYAESYIYEVLKSDGNLTNAKFVVKIW